MKQSSLDDPGLGMEYEGGEPPNNTAANEGDGELIVFLGPGGPGGWSQTYYEDQNNQSQITPKGKGIIIFRSLQSVSVIDLCLNYSSGLPWTPKVRQKDVDTFLEVARLKFVGYKLQGDRESLAGLPQPIHEGVTTLKKVFPLAIFHRHIEYRNRGRFYLWKLQLCIF